MTTTKHYFSLEKRTGKRTMIDPEKTAAFFSIISELTGLDRAMAEVILNGGKPIEHAHFRFFTAAAEHPRKK